MCSLYYVYFSMHITTLLLTLLCSEHAKFDKLDKTLKKKFSSVKISSLKVQNRVDLCLY